MCQAVNLAGIPNDSAPHQSGAYCLSLACRQFRYATRRQDQGARTRRARMDFSPLRTPILCAPKPDIDYRSFRGLTGTVVASHLRRAIPPGPATRDALISLRGIHPLPDIGAHVVQAIHASLSAANAGRTDASIEPCGAIQGKGRRAAIAQAICAIRALPCGIEIGCTGLEWRRR